VDLVVLRRRAEKRLALEGKEVVVVSETLDGVGEAVKGLREAIAFYYGLGFPAPQEELYVAIMGGSGGFRNDYLLSLDTAHLENSATALANALHEYAHTWLGSLLKPRSSEDLWVFEALPDYLAASGLDASGLHEQAKRILREAIAEARRALRSPLYTPPHRIHMPLTRRGLAIHRSVGVAVLDEIASKIGRRELLQQLARYIARKLETDRTFSWREFTAVLGEDVHSVLEKYRLL